MTMILAKRLALALCALLAPAVAGARAAEPVIAPITAIIGADVLPMTARERLDDQTVLIQDDRILRVGPRATTAIPAGARRIEARGLTLMPGLVDMHVHLAPAPGAPSDAARRAMAVMLAYGVTTARGMAGSPANLIVREAVESGLIPGPRLYAASPALNVNNVASPEAARAAVAAAHAAGHDLIKAHHLTDIATWQAVQDEARRLGMPVAGHVANEIGLDRAMAARQQIEHLDGALLALLPADAPERQIPFGQIPPPPVLAALARLTDADLDAFAARIRAAGSWHVPTLALFERIADVTTPAEQLRARPEMRYVPDPVLAQWAGQHGQLAEAGFTRENGEAFIALRRRIARALHRAGVPLMAGSDTAQSFHLWGAGLIAEIEALHAAGLTRLAALRSATLVPRDYLRALPNGGSARGRRADFGTVEAGARADLILLHGDPSRDLAALRRVDTVIAGGRIHDRAALDRMLDEASRAAKAVR
jgi:imidazolonepropionase-like amidohydrolase